MVYNHLGMRMCLVRAGRKLSHFSRAAINRARCARYTTAMAILVTGSAGFIGNEVVIELLAAGHRVIGVDNYNDYYDVQLKRDRTARLHGFTQYTAVDADIADRERIAALFAGHDITHVIHLAAQAGVRYSLENPHAYVDSNLVGFVNILEGCRHHNIEHLVYASSSSVYGANRKMPFAETDLVDHPVSLYAATKKANEALAHTYSHLYGLPTTGLRFFTVYGPWGRPDMAPFLFTSAIFEGRPIRVFNHGKMQRDFTFISDIVAGVVGVLNYVPTGDEQWNAEAPIPGHSYAPYAIYNIGNSQPVELMDFITTLEDAIGKKANMQFEDLQPGDVVATYADTSALEQLLGFGPQVGIADGVTAFVEWYREYYRV